MDYFISLVGLSTIGYIVWLIYKKVYIGVAERFVHRHPEKVNKVINQTSAISERGGQPTILNLGSDLMVDGGNFAHVEPNDTQFKVRPRIPSDALQNGGFRTKFASAFNAYVRRVTGYETNVQAFRDLFTKGVSFLKYDLKRPVLKKSGQWWEMEFRKEDFTTQVRHNREAFDFIVPPIDTGKMMKTVDPSGKEVEVPQRIPVSLKCQVFLRVDDPIKAIYKTGKNYLGFVLNILISEMRDVVQGMGYDDLLKPEAHKNIVEKMLKGMMNGDTRMTDGIHQKILSEIGVDILEIQIEDIFIVDDAIRTSVQQQGKELVEGQARVTKAQFVLEESKLKRQSDEELATGQAAYPQKRLMGLAEGAKAIQGVMREHSLTRDVVVADLHSQGVKEAKNGTIFVNAGGMPTPVFNTNPEPSKQDAGEKPEGSEQQKGREKSARAGGAK